MTKAYPSERAAALIREGVDILGRGEDDDSIDLKRIAFQLGGMMRDEGAAVAMTFDAIYRETAAEAKGRLPLIQRLIAVASKSGSRSRRQKGATKPNVPTSSRLQLLQELTAIKVLATPPKKEPVIAIPAEESGSGRERLLMRMVTDRQPMAELWVGADFALGRGRKGTISVLADIGAALGWGLHMVPPLRLEGQRLICTDGACSRVFRIEDGIPIMLLDEAEGDGPPA